MTSLRGLLGKPVVSRATAENLGALHGAVIDAAGRSVVAWQVGKGRHARLVDAAHIAGIGEAAAIVDEEASLRDAVTEAEKASVKGAPALIGVRILSDAGEELGHVVDVDVDTDTGALVSVSAPATQIEGSRIRGLGSFAMVVAAG